MSKILIGVIVIMGLGGYFLYNKNIELQKLNAAFEVRDAEQRATIKAVQDNLEKTSKALTGLQVKNKQYESQMTEYLDIFARHNIAKIASAKPGMIENRANNATKEVFDAIENDSKRISSLND
jgi:hypothetical protein